MRYERRERVGEIIRGKISEFILKEMNPDSLLSISRVVLTKDLREAKVYIHSLESNKSLEELKKVIPSIRLYLAKEINLRYTPSLSFFIEDGGDFKDIPGKG